MLVAIARGDLPAAAALVAASRLLARTAGRTTELLHQEAWLAEARGDDAQARLLLEEFVRREGAEQGEQSPNRLLGLALLARVMLRLGDTVTAVRTCAESLMVHRRIGPSAYLSPALQVLSLAAERGGLLTQSVRLLAALNVQSNAGPTAIFDLQAAHQTAVERVRTALDEAAFMEAWAAGVALSADAAIELGLMIVAELEHVLTGAAACQPS